MSLSENIKRIRLEQKLTQEQLASRLGISAQAISKWETTETYPDGSLLLPLAQELNVSLDELFDNQRVTMEDISARIIRLFSETPEGEQMKLARDIGWQIEKGIFNCKMSIDGTYSPDELAGIDNSSYILNDYGFTYVSNGKEPFFAVFPEPAEGFGYFAEEKERIREVFAALSSPDTMNAILYLMAQKENYIFEPGVIAKECNIKEENLEEVINNLTLLDIIWFKDINLNGMTQTLCHSRYGHELIALFIMAQQLLYNGGYCFQSHYRNKAFINPAVMG